MRHYTCDRTRTPIEPGQTTTLRLSGPLRTMVNRPELHLAPDQARELARWLGFAVQEPLDPDLGVFGVNLDQDATAADLAALRIQALQNGTPAGTRPPGGSNKPA